MLQIVGTEGEVIKSFDLDNKDNLGCLLKFAFHAERALNSLARSVTLFGVLWNSKV